MIRQRIEQFSKHLEKGSCDILVFCILSHGDKGVIYGIDGETVSFIKDIVVRV